MYHKNLKTLVGDTDIYLLDQIMKGRYGQNDIVLDAGCGAGRNLHWFLKNEIIIYGIDHNENMIKNLKENFSDLSDNNIKVANLTDLPFANNFFDHILCSAVLHFAESESQFKKMIKELVRVLKPGGSLFIRMATDIGIENSIILIKDGVYKIPDGSLRFLLTKSLLTELMDHNNLSFFEPLKTVNVNDTRCMATLVLQKNNG